jgi:hypothetical protein
MSKYAAVAASETSYNGWPQRLVQKASRHLFVFLFSLRFKVSCVPLKMIGPTGCILEASCTDIHRSPMHSF